ncbi:MAG: tRNA (guanine(46)-N(7))-methyltransferase TrmB [Coriobacteriales bacterium]
MRARRPKNLQDSYDRFGDWIEYDPASRRGSWRDAYGGGWMRIHLDLGCGKGGYAVERAKRNPQTLIIGVDSDDICVARCAELAATENTPNCVFCLADAELLPLMFERGEVDSISINFPTPLPRKKHAADRLVHARKLALCREALAGDGVLMFKTDSQPLFDFALTQFPLAGFEITGIDRSYDCISHGDIETLYEQRAKSLGASICRLDAAPCEIPDSVSNNASMSLVDYLPEDLDSLTYVPFGMEDTVFNMRNRRAREKRHAEKS